MQFIILGINNNLLFAGLNNEELTNIFTDNPDLAQEVILSPIFIKDLVGFDSKLIHELFFTMLKHQNDTYPSDSEMWKYYEYVKGIYNALIEYEKTTETTRHPFYTYKDGKSLQWLEMFNDSQQLALQCLKEMNPAFYDHVFNKYGVRPRLARIEDSMDTILDKMTIKEIEQAFYHITNRQKLESKIIVLSSQHADSDFNPLPINIWDDIDTVEKIIEETDADLRHTEMLTYLTSLRDAHKQVFLVFLSENNIRALGGFKREKLSESSSAPSPAQTLEQQPLPQSSQPYYDNGTAEFKSRIIIPLSAVVKEVQKIGFDMADLSIKKDHVLCYLTDEDVSDLFGVIFHFFLTTSIIIFNKNCVNIGGFGDSIVNMYAIYADFDARFKRFCLEILMKEEITDMSNVDPIEEFLRKRGYVLNSSPEYYAYAKTKQKEAPSQLLQGIAGMQKIKEGLNLMEDMVNKAYCLYKKIMGMNSEELNAAFEAQFRSQSNPQVANELQKDETCADEIKRERLLSIPPKMFSSMHNGIVIPDETADSTVIELFKNVFGAFAHADEIVINAESLYTFEIKGTAESIFNYVSKECCKQQQRYLMIYCLRHLFDDYSTAGLFEFQDREDTSPNTNPAPADIVTRSQVDQGSQPEKEAGATRASASRILTPEPQSNINRYSSDDDIKGKASQLLQSISIPLLYVLLNDAALQELITPEDKYKLQQHLSLRYPKSNTGMLDTEQSLLNSAKQARIKLEEIVRGDIEYALFITTLNLPMFNEIITEFAKLSEKLQRKIIAIEAKVANQAVEKDWSLEERVNFIAAAYIRNPARRDIIRMHVYWSY